MRTTWSNLGGLILLVLLIPLFLIIIGPMFVLAALRGQQRLGPITFNTSRYGPAGRAGALMLGLAIWLLVWSALAWIVVNGILPSSTVAGTSPNPPSATTPVATAIHTPAPPSPTATVTRAIPTESRSTPTPAITLTIVAVLSATPTPTAPPSVTATVQATAPITNTAIATATARPAVTKTSTPLSGRDAAGEARLTPLPSITSDDQQSIIAAVDEGNRLLQDAIVLANEENLDNLKRVWQGRALTKAEKFAVDHYNSFAKPFEVQFEYIALPTVGDESTVNQAVVISQESWRYGQGAAAFSETLEFIYNLTRENDGWVITSYTYRNVSGDGTRTPTPQAKSP